MNLKRVKAIVGRSLAAIVLAILLVALLAEKLFHPR
jgi:hypothetical protein